jgi:hypothetical protein
MGVNERPFCRFWIGPTVLYGGSNSQQNDVHESRFFKILRGMRLKKYLFFLIFIGHRIHMSIL